MEDVLVERSSEIAPAMRIAVVGCGHGTLDSIYASIDKACEVNGWDTVDLVIIGGDFQAVRDQRDLNVTAMPVKYRALKDFHQYYNGLKVAPYLTVFTGGNHEASNYLFELYHGGWVAPRIYYLGAANVVQCGPLKIAAMSGIWKGYDYRKPHYERLPYNSSDIVSIFHVREIDVRKLLAFRSQVDVGLSHDWPRGIVWHGEHKKLFNHKPFFREDAESGQLGSVAAEHVMDRLRPAFWFAAHLHTKYSALKLYKDEQVKLQQSPEPAQAGKSEAQAQSGSLQPASQPATTLPVAPHQQQLLAWGNFGEKARKEEAEVTAKLNQEERARREEAERTGIPLTANYTFEETYKKIKPGTGIQRDVESVSHREDRQPRKENIHPIPQLDGCCTSVPKKRRRESSSPPANSRHISTEYASIDVAQNNTTHANPDAIDIDMSDDDDDENMPLTAIRGNIVKDSSSGSNPELRGQQFNSKSDEERHSPRSQPVDTLVPEHTNMEREPENQTSQIPAAQIVDKRPDLTDHSATESASHNVDGSQGDLLETNTADQGTNPNEHDQVPAAKDEVSDEMRAKLAAISSKFEEPARVSAPLPPPENIKNKATKFLALSKCEDRQNFLQLIEIQPFKPPTSPVARPYKLRYVPEWLAIQRTFASELKLGGTHRDQIPPHKGDTYYREQIIENEKWVDELVVKPGHLEIPENFTRDIATYSSDSVTNEDMPREVTNSQTTTYCQLIGIDNPFDISEAERDARIAAGPAEVPSKNQHSGSGSRNFGSRNRAKRGGGSNWSANSGRHGTGSGDWRSGSQHGGNAQHRGSSERGGRGRGRRRGGRA